MSCHIPKALPSLFFQSHNTKPVSHIYGIHKTTTKPNKLSRNLVCKLIDFSIIPRQKPIISLAGQLWAVVLANPTLPALAVTGVNNEEDFIWKLIQLGISAFIYFLIVPPFIMNWLRIRWYRRGLLEMYTQFMFVFLFFPGILLWAPFLNFRKFPRDPTMKYPWSKPEDPSKIPSGFRKYPWATPEDYDGL
ncbi:NAD(P)H-quinone oxidoreductase subunit L, chloroplastic [Impatiens glandulifera]|uniref:NAD(P)H-quinone oxidoreductase subunit L, chloroplastic n=1 Tax=Impatiens glandulifera TaxID=253017 RepID=UPI001FB111C8|nr:NAD(P)H-quinone oxidoreductase subunit L, chloroplastic [Impatiens glandulifera]